MNCMKSVFNWVCDRATFIKPIRPCFINSCDDRKKEEPIIYYIIINSAV